MGNQVGRPWRNPEDELVRGRFEHDHIPPPTRPPLDASPLYRPPPLETRAEAETHARLRAQQRDCVADTLEFAKWPAALGVGWGAAMAAVHAKPDLKELNSHIGSRLTLGVKGIVRELKYLRNPVLFLGGFAALYAASDCTVAQLRGTDGALNSAVAGGVVGIAWGLFKRNPNTMFIFGTYGALAAAVAKLATLDPRANRPRANYYEVVEARKRAFHQEVRDGEAKDGYIHRWLDPQLKKLGVTVPGTWPEQAAVAGADASRGH